MADGEKGKGKKSGARSKQKLKILYLVQILLENTDELHDITLQEIIQKLEANGVTAERKSLYDDIAQLEEFGIKVEMEQYQRNYHYRIASRDFEIAELKLLVDSVQSAKFITEEKSTELIKKIERLASRPAASQLKRQVYVSGRVKAMNEEVLENVDAIHQAIAGNRMISFQYFQWNVKKQMELRHEGKRYQISPWGVALDDENYYLVGYDANADLIKHYRIDKMLQIRVENLPREGRQKFDQLDMGEYEKKMFGMFDGEVQTVSILCTNSLAGVMIDRFGKAVHMLSVDETHFRVNVKVAVSRHFLHWVMALGDDAKIIGPDTVVTQVKDEIKRLTNLY